MQRPTRNIRLRVAHITVLVVGVLVALLASACTSPVAPPQPLNSATLAGNWSLSGSLAPYVSALAFALDSADRRDAPASATVVSCSCRQGGLVIDASAPRGAAAGDSVVATIALPLTTLGFTLRGVESVDRRTIVADVDVRANTTQRVTLHGVRFTRQ